MELVKRNSTTTYSFSHLIAKHSKGVVAKLTHQEGYYDMENAGKWMEDKPNVERIYPAAIVPVSRSDLKFDSGGALNRDHRKLYCYSDMEKGTILLNLQRGGKLRRYTIISELDYSDFDEYKEDGLFVYFLERVDQFDEDPYLELMSELEE